MHKIMTNEHNNVQQSIMISNHIFYQLINYKCFIKQRKTITSLYTKSMSLQPIRDSSPYDDRRSVQLRNGLSKAPSSSPQHEKFCQCRISYSTSFSLFKDRRRGRGSFLSRRFLGIQVMSYGTY